MPEFEGHNKRRTRAEPQPDHSAAEAKPELAAGLEGMAQSFSASDFSQSAFERHAAMLGNSSLSQPMYARQRASFVQKLQRDYGNFYVQRLVDHVTRQRTETTQAKTKPLAQQSMKAKAGTLNNSAYTMGQDVYSQPQAEALVQRAVYVEGGAGAVAVTGQARGVAGWVTTKQNILPGGKNHIPDVQGRGLVGYKKGKDEYVGGMAFNNNAMPDNNKLPYMAGQTYKEWDVNAAVPKQNRGQERVVTTDGGGPTYYTNDHYKNFTKLK